MKTYRQIINDHTWMFLISGLILAIGLIHSYHYAFVNDDAFISFRYADNFNHGLGLVYNKGEHVEGYTNFLWTMIIAASMQLGFDPVASSTALGIIFYAGTLIIFILISRRYQTKQGSSFYPIFFPLAAIALTLNRDFNVYATSGLETSMYTFFIATSFFAISLDLRKKNVVIAGIFALLTLLTRPDGAIFFGCLVIYLFIINQNRWKNILYFIFPSLIIFIPYWIWRYNYYGFFFPNSFYAKSIYLPYYSQGIEYVWLYLKTYYGLFILFIPAIALLLKHRKNLTGFISQQKQKSGRDIILAVLFSVVYIIFVIRIGGDFMHARFLIPVTPFLYLIVERFILSINRLSLRYAAAIFIILSTIFRYDLYTKEISVGYVVDEYQYYTPEHLEKAKQFGYELKKYFKDLPVRFAFSGAQARVVYYAELPYAMEALTGLTDTALAHYQIKERGRPGHEKNASLEFLQKKKVNFYIGPINQMRYDQLPFDALKIDSSIIQIVTYDNRIMNLLSSFPELQFTKMDRYLDSYFSNSDKISNDQLISDYKFLRGYYFDLNEDTVSERKFLNFISGINKGNAH
ncbi:MAG: hypothetical protein HY964_03320 [Ignavibacteriales bacterium]|nr:hypothetical protein [Ignavibacteriales bacterium]